MKLLAFLTVFILLLTGCSKKNKNDNTFVEGLKARDNSTRILLGYNKNGKLKSLLIKTENASQNIKLLFDSTGTLRGTMLENGKSNHATEYYVNGKPKGLTNLDSTGTGDAVYYYDNGNKKSEGRMAKHQYTGIWKYYNKEAELTKIDTLK